MKLPTIRTIALLLLAFTAAVTAQAQWDMEGVEVDRTKYADYTPQWNPDPLLLIPGAGTTGLQQQGFRPAQAGAPNRSRRLQATATDDLPEHWNNAETIYFPPVFNQAGNSCGVSSRVGYMLNEELNAYRGTNATLDANRLSPNFEFPFSYDGTPKDVMAYYVGYPDMVTYGGFPYSKVYGLHSENSNNAGWMTGYDKWFTAMHNRIWSAGNFSVGVISLPTDEYKAAHPDVAEFGYGGFGQGAQGAKRYLYNHNGDTSFKTGGLIGLGCAAGSSNAFIIPTTSTNTALGVSGKKYWVTGTGIDHAVTMVGYDDRIEFDLDGNGTSGERCNSLGQDEVGAWIIVNSWGNGWANNGFVYVPYALASPQNYALPKTDENGNYIYTLDSENHINGYKTLDYYQSGWLNVDWNTEEIVKADGSKMTIKTGINKYTEKHDYSGWSGEVYNIRKDYSPVRTLKATLSFSQRSAISLQAGISTDLEATEPDEILTFHHFNYQGDHDGNGTDAMMPMLGQWTDGVHNEPMEMGYDLTDLSSNFDRTRPLKYFFIIDSKNTAVGEGTIASASILDYSVNPAGVETPFADKNVTIENAGGRTVISTIVYGEALNPPANLNLSGTTLSWDTPQGTNFTPASYNIYKDGELLGSTAARTYDIGTNTGIFTVKTVYSIDGNESLSDASNSVSIGGTLASFDSQDRYISWMGEPISSLDQLEDGMTVVLYNNGRGKYMYDNGAGNIYLFTGTKPTTLSTDDYKYVFFVSKANGNYSFRSMNGYIPVGTENSQSFTPSATQSTFTVEKGDADGLYYLKSSGGKYLNGDADNPVFWWATGDNSSYKIYPINVSGNDKVILSVGDEITSIDDITDNMDVALRNEQHSTYYMKDCGSSANYGYGNPLSLVGLAEDNDYTFNLKGSNSYYSMESVSGYVNPVRQEVKSSPTSTRNTFLFTYGPSGYSGWSIKTYSDGPNSHLNMNQGAYQAIIGWNSSAVGSRWHLMPLEWGSLSALNTYVFDPGTVYTGQSVMLSVNAEDIVNGTWTVGGNTYNATSPTIVFDTEGVYTVVGKLTNAIGATYTVSKDITVSSAPALTADFALSADEVAGSDRISFLSKNELPGCTYAWTMEGADEPTASTHNASATYSNTGTYTVTLTVTGPDGTSLSSSRTFNVVAAPPKLDYRLSKAVIVKGETVTITDLSKYAPTSWRWDLVSDLNVYTSFDQNPTFTPKPGVYTLYFRASNEAGTSTTSFSRALIVCNSASYNGLNFSGTTESANQVDLSLKNDITTAWTIDFWLRPTSFTSTGFGLTGTNGLTITSDGSGRVTVKDGSTVLAQSSANYYVESEWHHYAISYTGGKIYFNRDGSEVNNAACSLTDFTDKFASLTIGGKSAPCNGAFDEFRVWNTALSQAKQRAYAVEPISDVATAMSEDGLEVYYQFNHSSGHCADATTNGLTGTRSSFGPDGDAWVDSEGVFALNFDDAEEAAASGVQLDNTTMRVVGFSDEELSSELRPARYAIDGSTNSQSFWHSNYSSGSSWPRILTLRRSQLDQITSFILNYGERDSNYRVKTASVLESDDGETWTTVETGIPVPDASQALVRLATPLTKQYVRLSFDEGYGSYLAVFEIAFYGTLGTPATGSLEAPSELTVDIHTGDQLRNGTTLFQTWNNTWRSIDYPQITMTCSANNMSWASGIVRITTGGTSSSTFSINAASPFKITGYRFDGYAATTDETGQITFTPAEGGDAVTLPHTTNTAVSVSGLNTNATTFTISGANDRYLTLNNFVIYLAGEVGVVEYQIKDSEGALLHTAEDFVAVGTRITVLPSDHQRAYCTYSAINTTVKSGRNEVPVTCTWNMPFTISEENDTTYCLLKVKSQYAYIDGEGGGQFSASRLADTAPGDKWALFGNPYQGFRITSPVDGTKFLQGAEANGTQATLQANPTLFVVDKSNYSGGGFCLRVKGSTYGYLNHFDGSLKTWNNSNAISGEGSAFSVADPGDYAEYVESDIGPYLTTNVGTGYVGTLATADRDALQSEYDAAAVSTTTFSQYWSLLNKTKAALVPLKDGGYYRLRNAYFTDRYVYMNTTDRLLYYKSSEADALRTISSVCETQKNADGTWTLLFEGVPMYGVKTDADAYGTDPTYSGASASPAAVTFIEGTPGTYAIYAVNEGSSVHSYLHSNTKNFVQGWTVDAGASQWHLVPATTLVLTPATVESEGTGYASLCLPFPATIDEEDYSARYVNYYILEATDGETLATSIVADNVIPANTGVLLRRAATAPSEEIMLTIGGTSTASVTGNRFVGTSLRTDQDGSATTYVFSTKSGTTKGFYKLSTSSKIPANKAYFTDAAMNVRTMVMLFNDEDGGTLTDLTDLPLLDEPDDEGGQWSIIYDLQGRVRGTGTSTKGLPAGIYIVNGRKVIVK
ncbi:MAG: discoidin domain-containing protein [Bacteroidaceae bacterium]|nr:discoidin domain-containing protein [Bacteroidaceae bacterium]